VAERWAWGIDLFTYRNLLDFLPVNIKEDFKATHFMEKVLINSFYRLELEGSKIDKACEYIVNTEAYNKLSKDLAKHLLRVKKNTNVDSFTAYSKGVGLFNLKKEGIKQNELISPYFGEIYPPWLWYEKQDIIKQNKLDKDLPDFYNIMLERLKCDKDGYDLVMVDPNSKGNFSSRMSHSCTPNCNTVLMASGGSYTIGMFATKDIEYGEELTFDYNSVTEKEKEFQRAICLCSSYFCRGRYLLFSNSMVFTEILFKHHSFLHRNAILLQACTSETLTEEDIVYLDRYSIKTSILQKAPTWLKKWAALILRFVEQEEKLLLNEFCKKNNIEINDSKPTDSSTSSSNGTADNNYNENMVIISETDLEGYDAAKVEEKFNRISQEVEDETNAMKISIDLATNLINYQKKELGETNSLDTFKYQISAIAESRIQNIAITIDKVIHVLDLLETREPPLIKLNEQETFEYLWEGEFSLKTNLLNNLTHQQMHLKSPQVEEIITVLKEELDTNKGDVFKVSNKREINYEDLNNKARLILITVAKKLSTCSKSDLIFFEGLADILLLHANTLTLFKHSKHYNKSVKSAEVGIRNRDIQCNVDKDLDSFYCKGFKEYDRFYIWGQLVGWFKQTVDKPNASLSAERRGTLSYPEIDSFFVNSTRAKHQPRLSNIFNYPYGSRKTFYNKLLDNPSMMWPVGNDWSFKNRNK
jgi:hypothetical protein